MKRTRTLRSSAGAVATIAISLTACGTGNFIDQGELESAVVDGAPASLQVDSASCPEEVSSDAGTGFTCTVTTADGDIEASGTVVSEGEEEVGFDIDYGTASGATGPTGPES